VKTRLVFALHFHQPVGNFDAVFRDAIRLCYAPIVDHFERHPGVGAAFHLSGCLLEWLERHDRGFLDRVVSLVASRRVEPLGGGFYEPILPVIPREDALDQIDRLARYWQNRCGIRPRGAWIAERVWEPGLAGLLSEAGVDYTILDDQHLRFAGLLDDRFSGLFVTERAGKAVAFFPSDFQLRYLIPFRTVEAVRDHFQKFAGDSEERVLTYGDDAEKFGFWPGTHAWVFGAGWLERFFSLLEEEGGPVRAVSPGSYLAERPPVRKVYVPNASYTEMLEWALPPDSAAAYGTVREGALRGAPAESVRAFVRGSLWDMFLSRYPEVDQLHKHVLWTSRRARALPDEAPGREEAITAALRAQCNCVYWHGLFGGLYYPHLRHGAYESVLLADAILGGGREGRVRVEALDLDGDLEEEVILLSGGTQAFFRPSDGGTLVELDYLPSRFNVTNVVSRWKESYHQGADLAHAQEEPGTLSSPHEQAVGIKPADLEGRHFDILPLRSLRDFWSANPPRAGGLSRFEGMDLLSGRLRRWEKTAGGFRGEATVGPVSYEKIVSIDSGGTVRVAWHLAIPDDRRQGWFGTVLCLSLLTRQAADRSLLIEGSGGGKIQGAPGDSFEMETAERITLEDRAFGFALDLIPHGPAWVATCPIETLQRSEDRYEAAYQGTLIALSWSRAEPRGGPQDAELRMSFRKLASTEQP